MIAARDLNHLQVTGGVNAVQRRDGSVVELANIRTAAEGQALLDENDAAILAIEEQLENWADGRGGPDRVRRAKGALKRKRRIRPALQQRIAVLRKAEERAEFAPADGRAFPRRERSELRRVAFVNAAEQLLDHKVFTEIWARAAEIAPDAFASEGGSAV